MPTPFSHLATIYTLLDDERVPARYRSSLALRRPAFLLGAVAPDARIDAPDPRAATHFYTYQEGISTAPWRLMLTQYPSLVPTEEADKQAFLAGYVAHLAMDEVWTREMLGPHFANGTWGADRKERFFVLHLLLIDMDQRDLDALPADVPQNLRKAAPTDDWLPFMPLAVLEGWRDLIYEQVKPGGSSKTLDIFGARVKRSPEELRELADDPEWMQAHVWDHVPPTILTAIQAHMAAHARASLVAYLDEFTTLGR